MTDVIILNNPKNNRFNEIKLVEETGSTNRDLLDLARKSQKNKLNNSVLITKHQTKGRGRNKKSWIDTPGRSLLMSVMLPKADEYINYLSIVTGLALYEFAESYVKKNLNLKWPNDLMVGDSKLSGILVETTVSDSITAVIGIGLNLLSVKTESDNLDFSPISIEEESGKKLEIEHAAFEVLDFLDKWLKKTDNPEAIIDCYSKRCSTIGKSVIASTAKNDISGRAIEINSQGHLVVQDNNLKKHEIFSGELNYLR